MSQTSLYDHPDIDTYFFLEDRDPHYAYLMVGKGQFATHHNFNDSEPQVEMKIDNESMDRIAVAWCKHRGLQGELGGPVGKEYGSPCCDYD